MTTTIKSAWKTDYPESVGFYIASTTRRADMVRLWTGKHWTAPVAVADMHLPGRMPTWDSPAARAEKGRPIEWLESVVVDDEGFISWGGQVNDPPYRGRAQVEVQLRAGGRAAGPSTQDWRWQHDGGGADIVAYRVLEPGECPADAAAKPSNPKDMVGVRKAPMSTVSAAVLAEVGVAMLEGASKYGRHNYRAVGVRSSVYYDGTMRHLMAWWEGQDIDPDSGMNHITKAITSLIVLRDAMIQGKCEDDRAPRSADFYTELNTLAGQIIDRHADKNPRHYTIADSEV